jgi:predicted metal-dependent hydrolase
MDRENTHQLIDRLSVDAGRIAAPFGLRYKSLAAERANVKNRYGVCFSDGEIRIRLRHVTTGRPLKYSSLVNTLCHELAHLRYFNHGLRFRALYSKLLEYARAQGIYRPRDVRACPDPRTVLRAAKKRSTRTENLSGQLSLFP